MIWTGRIRLTFVQKEGRTIVEDSFHEGAFKLSRPVFLVGTSPTYFLIHVGGGYVGGDRYQQYFCLDEGAKVTLTTQSATKVYKTTGEPARQETEVIVRKGSFLTYVQDPLIAYEGARYILDTTIHMDKGAGVLLTDIFTPGWSMSREDFTYDWIRSKMNVFYDGRRLLMDHLLLQPSDQMESILFMEGYSHFGSLLFIHEGLSEEILKELEVALSEFQEQARIGFSRLPTPGLMVRVLAHQTQLIEKVLSVCENILRYRILHTEAASYRKY